MDKDEQHLMARTESVLFPKPPTLHSPEGPRGCSHHLLDKSLLELLCRRLFPDAGKWYPKPGARDVGVYLVGDSSH